MLKKEKEYIVVGLGEDIFKLAHLKVGTACVLLDVLKRDVRQLKDEELPQTIRSACEGINTRKLKALFIVPPHVITTKNIEIPSLDPVEIKSIIDLQAGRHTPYAPRRDPGWICHHRDFSAQLHKGPAGHC